MNYIVLDTETTNTLEQPIAYDIGWAVINEAGDLLKTASYAVAEIFLDKELMSSAYYAEKIPTYWEEIKSGNRILANLYTIVKALREDIRAYGVKLVFAHNCRFDDLSTKLTERYLTGSKYRYLFPKSVTLCDTLKMCREVFGKDDTYKKWCEENGFMTAHHKPRARLTAEVVYRFISGEIDFTEAHKGLDDVLIEAKILTYCIAKGCEPMPLWKLPDAVN